MPLIVRQTIKPQKIPFWKFALMIVASIFIMDVAVNLFARFSPVVGSLVGLAALFAAAGVCFRIIYKQIAYYNYKIIQEELIMERVIGRANHLFLSVKLYDLEKFEPYNPEQKEKVAKLYRFISGANTKNWYIGEFTRSGDKYRFIFEPNEELLKTILTYRQEK